MGIATLRPVWLLVILWAAVPAVARNTASAFEGDELAPAKSPEEALAAIKVPDGLRVELVACEPLVIDPVAIDFGPDGKLWVAEMLDYPAGINGDYAPGGRIRFLEDTDADGKYDKATIFVENIPYPTGVTVWKKGVMYCAAPDVVYAEDTNGDGQADVQKVLLTGFDTRNFQARINSLRYGLDNWVYAANGLLGGKLTSPQKADFQVDLGSRDFRFNPDTLAFDLEPGRTQQGLAHDDWGNWFGTNNSELLLHYPLPDHYVRRNPNVAAAEPVVLVPKEDPDKLYPRSRTLQRFNHPESANRVTSACGAVIYRDELLGREYAGNAFVCEPVHNLVTRRILKPEGSTFSGVRAPTEQQAEFLASTDNWFRPVDLQTGPDGALWVVDMYRAIIEHPKWITADRLATLDLRAGDDKGRIYRIVPVDKPARKPVVLESLDTPSLVQALDSPNGTQREMAQFLLVHRGDLAAVPVLKKLAKDCQRPQARMQALCALDGLKALNAQVVIDSLRDPNAGVRRHAIRLLETFLTEEWGIGPELARLVNDSDPHVRLQLACTLGEWKDPLSGEALGQIALASRDDKYIIGAVFSSVTKENLAPLAAVVMTADSTTDPPAYLLEQIVSLATTFEVDRVLVEFTNSLAANSNDGTFATWQLAAVTAMLDGLDRTNVSLVQLAERQGDLGPAMLETLNKVFAFARIAAADSEANEEARLAAVKLLGRGPDHRADDIAAAGELFSAQTPTSVQRGVIAALGKLKDDQVPRVLLDSWRRVGPSIRSDILTVLMTREEWTTALLDRIESKDLQAGEIDATRRQQLSLNRNKELAARAAKLLAGSVNADRSKVIEQYKPVATGPGKAERGAQLFEKTCSICHRLNDKGYAIGPDLVALTDKSPQALLTAILDPNRNVDQKFGVYNAITTQGLSVPGILSAETGSSITITQQENKQTTIIRSDLDELVSTGKSLMPEGLEKDLKPADVADIIAYVASTGPSRRTFEGNDPAVVTTSPDGNLMLRASMCEIYGKQISFEVLTPERQILTTWKGAEDRADWTAEIPTDGEYTVSLHYSCQNDSAGNAFLFENTSGKISGKISGTGKTWTTYFPVEIGKLKLKAGKQRFSLRADGEIKGEGLANVAHVLLIPAR